MFLAREHHGGNHPPKVVFWTLQNGKTNTSSRNKFLLKLTPDNFLLRITFFFLNQNETVDGWNPREPARFQTNAGFHQKNRPPSQSEGFQDQSDWLLGGQKRFIKSQLFLEIWHPSMEDFFFPALYLSLVSACFKMVGLCSTQTLKQSWDWCDGSRVPQCVPLMIPPVGEHCLESRGITCFQYLIVLVAIDVDYKPPFTSHPAVIALGVQMKLEIPD